MTWVVKVQGKAASPEALAELGRLKVRNATGQMVSLSTLVTVQREKGPGVVQRLNLYPMARVTANLAPGVSLAEARAYCESEAAAARTELGLSSAYDWIWMQTVSARK